MAHATASVNNTWTGVLSRSRLTRKSSAAKRWKVRFRGAEQQAEDEHQRQADEEAADDGRDPAGEADPGVGMLAPQLRRERRHADGECAEQLGTEHDGCRRRAARHRNAGERGPARDGERQRPHQVQGDQRRIVADRDEAGQDDGRDGNPHVLAMDPPDAAGDRRAPEQQQPGGDGDVEPRLVAVEQEVRGHADRDGSDEVRTVVVGARRGMAFLRSRVARLGRGSGRPCGDAGLVARLRPKLR